MPCTDWFVTFTHLGKGDSTRAIAATPVLLIAQLGLLPLYLWLFMGNQFDVNLELGRHLLPAFGELIIVPLILAFLTEKWAETQKSHRVHSLHGSDAGPSADSRTVHHLNDTGQPDRQYRLTYLALDDSVSGLSSSCGSG